MDGDKSMSALREAEVLAPSYIRNTDGTITRVIEGFMGYGNGMGVTWPIATVCNQCGARREWPETQCLYCGGTIHEAAREGK